MSESDNERDELPPIGQLRLVEVDGARRLALDIARREGKPVAVVGPGAVDCGKCGASDGMPCFNPWPGGKPLDYPHMERVFLMNKEIDRLLKEGGER